MISRTGPSLQSLASIRCGMKIYRLRYAPRLSYSSSPSSPPSSSDSQSSQSTSVTPGSDEFNKRFAQQLRQEGFTETQSEALIALVAEAIHESTQAVSKETATKEDMQAFHRSHLEPLQDMSQELKTVSSESMLKLQSQMQTLSTDATAFRDSLNDDLARAHCGARLDVNLEKKRVMDEMHQLDSLVKACESKIEQEVDELNKRLDYLKKGMERSMRRFALAVCGLYIVYKGVVLLKN